MEVLANRNSKNLSKDQVMGIISLIEDGRNQKYVANLVDVNQSAVSRVVALALRYWHLLEMSHNWLTRDNNVCWRSILNSSGFATKTCSCNSIATWLVTVYTTVRQILRQSGIRTRVAASAPRLTRKHHIARLTFARKHVNWKIDNWTYSSQMSRDSIYTLQIENTSLSNRRRTLFSVQHKTIDQFRRWLDCALERNIIDVSQLNWLY